MLAKSVPAQFVLLTKTNLVKCQHLADQLSSIDHGSAHAVVDVSLLHMLSAIIILGGISKDSPSFPASSSDWPPCWMFGAPEHDL
jgi:hypothetical protein